ncbi:hypothetical protein H9P43_001426 [Blastocladiella emersonii ATCC 22665]|nr:hypothetical protein H9P43_001426 [Blastocladiella emersonii ATCC 22665]
MSSTDTPTVTIGDLPWVPLLGLDSCSLQLVYPAAWAKLDARARDRFLAELGPRDANLPYDVDSASGAWMVWFPALARACLLRSDPGWIEAYTSLLAAEVARLGKVKSAASRRDQATELLPMSRLLPPSTSAALANARSTIEFLAADWAGCLETCDTALDPLSPNTHVRAADCCFKLGHYRAAVFRFWTAIFVAARTDPAESRVRGYCTPKLRDLRVAHDTSICVGQIFESDAQPEVQRAIEAGSAALGTHAWPPADLHAVHSRVLYDVTRETDWLAPTEPGARIAVPHVVSGIAQPTCAEDVQALAQLGVGFVTTTTAEHPRPPEWFAAANPRIEHVHLPVLDGRAPTAAQVDCWLRLVVHAYHTFDGARGGFGSLIHCAGGKGRTGSFIAAYLVRFGSRAPPALCTHCTATVSWDLERQRIAAQFNFDAIDGDEGLAPEDRCPDPACALRAAPQMPASEAVAQLRAVRPGSIETSEQEAFVRAYADVCWKRHAGSPQHALARWDAEYPREPARCGPEVFSLGNLPRIVLLMGLPGSGKSHFARALQAQLPDALFVVVDSDDGADLAAAVSNYARSPDLRLIVDACHPTAAHRVATFANCFDPPAREVMGVHFAAPARICAARAANRHDHPTLEPHRAGAVVAQFAAQMKPPRFPDAGQARHRSRGARRPAPQQSSAASSSSAAAVPADPEAARYGAWYTVHTFQQTQALLDSLTRPDSLMVKFPRTAHLFPGAASIADDDVVVPDLAALQQRAAGGGGAPSTWTVEEKIDGANLGLHAIPLAPLDLAERAASLDGLQILAQNRSHFVASHTESSASSVLERGPPQHPQFAPLRGWLAAHTRTLAHLLLPGADHGRRVLFGEWAVARHSVHYHGLPDQFVAFDLYDVARGAFLSRGAFHAALDAADAAMRADSAAAGTVPEPPLARVRAVWSGTEWPAGLESLEAAEAWVRGMPSAYGAEVPEGIVVRRDDDARGVLVDRAKYVRTDFIAGDEHWTKHGFTANTVRYNE